MSQHGGLDISKLKLIVIERWRSGGENTLVKVFPLGAGFSAASAVGYTTSIKYIAGRTPSEMELVLGFAPGTKLRDGAEVFRVNPLPSPDQFDLRGYTQTPAGVAQINGIVLDERFPPGQGAPQWELSRYPQSCLRWLATVRPTQPFVCRYSDLPTEVPMFLVGGTSR